MGQKEAKIWVTVMHKGNERCQPINIKTPIVSIAQPQDVNNMHT